MRKRKLNISPLVLINEVNYPLTMPGISVSGDGLPVMREFKRATWIMGVIGLQSTPGGS